MSAVPDPEVGMSRTHVSNPKGVRSGRRLTVPALAAAGAALIGLSYFLPWWRFALFAPQYPKGLRLVISLKGVSGDVQEIDIINHYIGMASLSEGARLERALSGWATFGLAALAFGLVAFGGRRLAALGAAAAAAFPLGFVLDLFYWMYRFGHELDPRAPITLAPFTPTVLGAGKVGQFRTLALPDVGFAVAAAGAVVLAAAVHAGRRRPAAGRRARGEGGEREGAPGASAPARGGGP